MILVSCDLLGNDEEKTFLFSINYIQALNEVSREPNISHRVFRIDFFLSTFFQLLVDGKVGENNFAGVNETFELKGQQQQQLEWFVPRVT